MHQEKHLYLNGQWVSGEGPTRQIINPATSEIFTTIREASKEQAEEAIEYAAIAFQQSDWAVNKKKRIEVLKTAAGLLEESADEVARLETLNTGKPIREAILDIHDSAACLRYYADLITQEEFWKKEMADGTVSEVRKEPIGVCSLIVPWNFPLLLGMWKIAPALAAGNTVIYKPSEITPVTALKFTEILVNSGIPAGVFNLVLGEGDPVGQTLVSSEKVDKVSFTGGSETGRKINQECAGSFKRVSLELGGKSPLIVLEDADIKLASEWAIFGSFFNQGEVCVASSRLLVHEKIYAEFIDNLLEKVKNLKIGDPLKEETDFGPVISEQHLKKIEDYIKIGNAEGAECLYGGKRIGSRGLYITPVIFGNINQDMRIVQEEIFGPVVTIQTFKTEQEAIELANGTKFGLAAGILSADAERASRIASQIKAGTIWINSYHTPYVEAPWGGYKQSGIGRELGPQGLDGFTETKHINKRGQLEPLNWYSFEK
jgi:betaine-aldehyde dehydrogenase